MSSRTGPDKVKKVNLTALVLVYNLILPTVLLSAKEQTILTDKWIIREIESSVDHSHCTTRQFQHMTFCHKGIWFVFYSDGRDFWYQTSDDQGRSWKRSDEPVDQAPNGSSSFDVLKVDNMVMSAMRFIHSVVIM